MAFGNLNDLSRRLEYAGQHVLFHGTSPYGSLVVTQVGRTTQLHRERRAAVLHRQRRRRRRDGALRLGPAPDARRVLLISGGCSGTAREVLKYPVEAVDYVDLDPLILDVAHRYVPESLADPRIHVINADGRRFVRQTDRRYDVVIVDVPDPSTSQTQPFLHAGVFRRGPPHPRARRGAVVLAGRLRRLSQPGVRPADRRCAIGPFGRSSPTC